MGSCSRRVISDQWARRTRRSSTISRDGLLKYVPFSSPLSSPLSLRVVCSTRADVDVSEQAVIISDQQLEYTNPHHLTSLRFCISAKLSPAFRQRRCRIRTTPYLHRYRSTSHPRCDWLRRFLISLLCFFDFNDRDLFFLLYNTSMRAGASGAFGDH